MAMPVHAPFKEPRRWTVPDLERLPNDGNRYEIIDGTLYVTPAPSLTHQRAGAELYAELRTYLGNHGIGEAFFAPADLECSNETMVEPSGGSPATIARRSWWRL